MLEPVNSVFIETEEKRSRFLNELIPVSDETALKQRQAELRLQHPKASHVCYGFRYINEHSQVVEGFSDDGEPGGTAGQPILKVLQHHGVVNAAVLITRYFGGTKLGTGGLQRAYSQGAGAVCAQAEPTLREYRQLLIQTAQCDFAQESTLRRLIAQTGLCVIKEEYVADGPVLALEGTQEAFEQLINAPEGRLIRFSDDQA